ncbi:MAG: hypothetical protein Q8911_00065 [Bacillota bacterium]|nr:hypothetical protein [Bacillota bacterium]
MSFTTKDSFVFDFASQVDYPNWTPAQTKQNLNARGEELRLALNAVVNLLNSVNSGATGADNIGATAPTGLTGETVQAILNSLKTAIDGVSLGAIPDGSLTDAKLSPNSKKTIPPVVTTNVGNAYSVTVTGITALSDMLPLCVKFNAASTGAITVNLNNFGAISVVDYFGNAVTNVRTNLIANLRYDAVNQNFQLQGKGGGGNATKAQLLNGATATVDSGPITGDMPENGPLNYTPSASPQIIPEGHTTGGTVAAVTFNAAKVLNDTTIAGTKGTMVNQPGTTTANNWYADGAGTLNHFIPYGAYLTDSGSGSGTPNVKAYDPNFIPSNILITARVFGLQGTMIPFSNGLIAGSAQYLSDTTSYSSTSTSWTKVGKRYTVNYSGSIRFSFQGFQTVVGQFQVYKNGVAFGTLRNGTAGQWVAWTEDYTCNAGDYFEVYVASGTSNASYPIVIQYTTISLGNMSTPAVTAV